MKQLIKSLLLISAFSFSAATLAEALPQEALQIDSDAMAFDNKTGEAVHTGKVIMRQGETTLLADRVTIQRDKTGEIKSLIAEGAPAHLTLPGTDKKPKLEGTAKNIDYQTENRIVTLTGEAELSRGEDIMHSEAIEYHMQNETILAKPTPGARTHIILQPQKPG